MDSTKSSLSGWMVDSLTAKVSFNYSILETRRLLRLEILSGDHLTLYSWWISLDKKLTVYGRMDLVEVMATDAKRAMIPKFFGMPLLSCIY